jgi:hypothetical protein
MGRHVDVEVKPVAEAPVSYSYVSEEPSIALLLTK